MENKEIKTTGQSIRALRKKRNMTQAELANAIGKSLSTIQKYESDSIYAPLEIRNKIAATLNGSWNFVFNFNADAPVEFFSGLVANDDIPIDENFMHYYMLSPSNFTNEHCGDDDFSNTSLCIGGLNPTTFDSRENQIRKLFIQLCFALGYVVIYFNNKIFIKTLENKWLEVSYDDFSFWINDCEKKMELNMKWIKKISSKPSVDITEIIRNRTEESKNNNA